MDGSKARLSCPLSAEPALRSRDVFGGPGGARLCERGSHRWCWVTAAWESQRNPNKRARHPLAPRACFGDALARYKLGMFGS